MKGLDPQYYQHQINLLPDTRPVQQRRYRMNPYYAAKVKEEIDKLLRVCFIRPVKRATWLSPIMCWETCPSGWNRMEDAENRLITEPAPIGTDRLEGQRCKYAEKSYGYKYDLGHTLCSCCCTL